MEDYLENQDNISEAIDSKGESAESLVPENFPVVQAEGSFFGDDEPEWVENVVIKFETGSLRQSADKYVLQREIGEFKYLFKLYPEFGNPKSTTWTFIFKTKDYNYGTTNLSEGDRRELFQCISAFFDSVQADVGEKMQYIDVSPADSKYSAEELEDCVQAILKTRDNRMTREQLLKHYSGVHLFDHYEKITGKPFDVNRDFRESGGGKARSRLFRAMFKKHLKNWEIDEEVSGYSLYLKPKSS